MGHLFAHIHHTGRTNKLAHGQRIGRIIGAILAGNPMDGGIKMGAGMFTQVQSIPIPGRPFIVVVGDHFHGQPRRGGEDRWQIDHWGIGAERLC